MAIFEEILLSARSLIPVLIAVLIAAGIIWAARRLIDRRYAGQSGFAFRRQVISLGVAFIALIVVIMLLPVSDNFRGQLLSFIGILFTAAIALSSTTLLGNIMAGLMLRVIRGFKPGDFISVGDQFGRVSGQSLAHVEIQTEFRDLVNLPNLYLVSHPVKVIRESGTIVHAEVSLGYDIAHERVIGVLQEAAKDAGLEDGFVQVLQLGDFSITYRVAGLLKDTKTLISTRSTLHTSMLSALHRNGIEIVSPTFMNTRSVDDNPPFIPKREKAEAEIRASAEPDSESGPEKVIFDKAEEAASIEKLREALQLVDREIEKLKEEKSDLPATETDERKQLFERLQQRRERLLDLIKAREEEPSE